MYEAQGVGLAAPQIGISLQLVGHRYVLQGRSRGAAGAGQSADRQGGGQADRRRRLSLDSGLPRESGARKTGHHPGAGRKRELVREDRRRPAGARLPA